MATVGLEDMTTHFLPHRKSWVQDGRTWFMLRQGREVRSRTDYLLWIYLCLFQNIFVRYPWNNSYHYMVLGCLCVTTKR